MFSLREPTIPQCKEKCLGYGNQLYHYVKNNEVMGTNYFTM